MKTKQSQIERDRRDKISLLSQHKTRITTLNSPLCWIENVNIFTFTLLAWKQEQMKASQIDISETSMKEEESES